MNNTLGKIARLTLFGESHGKYIGAVLDGLPAGVPVAEGDVRAALDARRPAGAISTARRETDEFEIVSGVYNGYTSGSPLCIIIPNADTRSVDYTSAPRLARPGHADFTSNARNAGFEDFRGGGHFSGRLTAPIVALGAVVRSALEAKGVYIGTHILSIGSESERRFSGGADEVMALRGDPFPTLDKGSKEKMRRVIEAAKSDGDSVGGVLECAVCGVPAGVGDPWFGSVEGVISNAVFSVPAIKGIEFGAGFALSSMRGSEANDPFVVADGTVATLTDNCGGVLGGLSTGGMIVFRAAVKPTPTISKEQQTVDLVTGEAAVIAAKGRHDPCIVHRAACVVSSVTALAVADMLAARFGEEYLRP